MPSVACPECGSTSMFVPGSKCLSCKYVVEIDSDIQQDWENARANFTDSQYVRATTFRHKSRNHEADRAYLAIKQHWKELETPPKTNTFKHYGFTPFYKKQAEGDLIGAINDLLSQDFKHNTKNSLNRSFLLAMAFTKLGNTEQAKRHLAKCIDNSHLASNSKVLEKLKQTIENHP